MNFVVRLSGEVVDGERACCLGVQLVRIITVLGKSLDDLVWYGADIEAIGESDIFSSSTATIVGDSQQLIEYARKVDQFLRGVFMAVPIGVSKPNLRKDIDTEDPVDVDLEDAIIEIRAFDTSFFEILTSDKQVANQVAETFGVQLCGECYNVMTPQ